MKKALTIAGSDLSCSVSIQCNKHGSAIGKGGVGPTHHFYTLYQKAGLFLND